MPPHDGTSGSPRPRNARLDSSRIADATPNVAVTKIGWIAFGRMCLKTMRRLGMPSARAAEHVVEPAFGEELAADEPCAAGPAR